jgi:hypothetical protein
VTRCRGQGQRLQQRDGGRQSFRADDGGCAGDRPLRADHGGQRRQQFGDVKVFLPLGSGKFGKAEIGQPGFSVASDYHVRRSQAAMSDPGAVQPAYFSPQPLEQLVADRPAWKVDERGAAYAFHDE